MSIKHHKNLTIIGTSHIAKQSIEQVKQEILEKKPKVVALELDKQRLLALLDKKTTKRPGIIKTIRRIGIKGFLFSLVGEYFERKLGEKVKTKPGDEMLTGFFAAKQTESRVALVDQDITITLRRFSEKLSWKERFRFFADILKAIVMPKKQLKELGIPLFDLNKVPDEKTIKKLTKILKDRYPNVYTVIVEERNEVIARNLHKLMQLYDEEPIIAVLGAGHTDEVIEIIKEKTLINQ